jgi:hypothetical protein
MRATPEGGLKMDEQPAARGSQMDEQPKGRRRWLGRWLERYGFKEVVAAFIALLIVGSTVVLSFVAVAQVGHSQQMQDAMDLLAAMSGLVGVVLGYHFGRVPAACRRHDDHGDSVDEQAAATTRRGNIKRLAVSGRASGLILGLWTAPQGPPAGGSRRWNGSSLTAARHTLNGPRGASDRACEDPRVRFPLSPTKSDEFAT